MPRRLRLILAAALLLSAAPVLALEWPVDRKVITGTFGEDRGDHFHNGIDLGGGSQDVHPVLEGELVFRYDENEDFSSLPRGTGSLIVLRHSQDILSFYYHLADGSLGPERTRYSSSDRIGIAGDTGHSEGTHLHLGLYDLEAGSAVNPLSVLPPLSDRQPPMIRRVILAVGDQQRTLQNGTRVRTGSAEVLAEVYDLREDVRFHWPLAPYDVRLALDGKEVRRLDFDTLSVREGQMVLGPPVVTREQLYTPQGLLRCGSVELQVGESRILIAARDFAGNETVKEIAITVTE